MEKVSVCITVFNEKKKTINKLLNALNNQTLKADEIIIIDAKNYNNCSRSRGRNIAISKAKNEIIAITDAGCVPHKDWLKNLIKLVKNNIVSAGFYEMVYTNKLQKAMAIFLGTQNLNSEFLPSARSMAFTKTIWKKAGGFPEKMGNTAEDTLFNINLMKAGAKFKTVKNAIVDWQMPDSIKSFYLKIKSYAKGDAESGIWWHPVKKLKTHNLKILTIFLRYILFVLFPWLILIYIIYSYYKAGLWGIILQFTSDFAGIIGFTDGILQTSFKRT